MIVSDIIELELRGVFDRGVPNLERIALYVKIPLNIGQFGLMIGVKGSDGSAYPLKDNLFWFGDGFVSAGDWVFVYTGAGKTQSSDLPGSASKLYTVHWGKSRTLFTSEELVPILFRVDAVSIAQDQLHLSGPQK